MNNVIWFDGDRIVLKLIYIANKKWRDNLNEKTG